MAAQKIQDKQKAILEAAIAVFAARGFWNTPTSLISKTAGVADGTLFNYFATKDDLISEVYLEIKREMAAQMLEGFPSHGSVKDKMRHIWNRYIEWGLLHPEQFKVIHQISESFTLNESVKAQATEPFVEIERIARESIENGELRAYPVDYLAAIMDNLAVLTVQFIAKNDDKQIDYKAIGFEILWNGAIR
ncbi:MAG: TetR/AcrR family transcriptional regulator [Chloroflexota bacterium]